MPTRLSAVSGRQSAVGSRRSEALQLSSASGLRSAIGRMCEIPLRLLTYLPYLLVHFHFHILSSNTAAKEATFRDSEIPGFRDLDAPSLRHSDIPRLRNSEIPSWRPADGDRRPADGVRRSSLLTRRSLLVARPSESERRDVSITY